MAISVHITDPFLRDELADFLRRATCRVTLQDGSTLGVEVPGAQPHQDGVQIDLFIAAWRGLHSNVDAFRVEDPMPPESPMGTATVSRVR